MKLCVAKYNTKVYFVTKSGLPDGASDDLVHSHQMIAEFSSSSEHLEWISEDKCLSLPVSGFSESTIFVLDQFEGALFDHLSSKKVIVLGPRCVLACHLTNDVVPSIASPIFTLTMKDVEASTSGFEVDKRLQIQKLLSYMGGSYTESLMSSNTHLITNSVLTPKYQRAVKTMIEIMTGEWIFDSWKLNQIENSEEFDEKYHAPIFYNINITSTGISGAEKEMIIKLISENGGSYNGMFMSRTTDILICPPNPNTNKFNAAVQTGKECLVVGWVKDSVAKGYALSLDRYRISNAQMSTSEQVVSTIFRYLSFAIYGFNKEETIDLKKDIGDGIIIDKYNFTTMVDYLIIPLNVNNLGGREFKFKNIVTESWIADCVDAGKLLEVQYYHGPILLKKDEKCLQGLQICVSTYIDCERIYLQCVSRALGAEVNEKLIRNLRPILLCPEAHGAKYDGAIKWKLPVVKAEWLLKCLDLEQKVPLRPYLVGEAICEENEDHTARATDLSFSSLTLPFTAPSDGVSFQSVMENPNLDDESMFNRYDELFKN